MLDSSEEAENVWGVCDGRVAVALGYVLKWLCGRELARAGAVCRAWRRAAAHPRHWRRLLAAECNATYTALRALALYDSSERCHETDDNIETAELERSKWSWRDEYVQAVAGWRHVRSLHPLAPPQQSDAEGGAGSGVNLLHAALAPEGDAFAVAAEDASITVFIRSTPSVDAWKVSWQVSLRRRGWRAAARVEWAPAGGGAARGGRVLAAGPLALAERWELLVLAPGAGGAGARVLARAGGAAPAPGCWVSHDAFLSLELRLLAPHRAVTTVWLNSATQEEHSEFTGVAAPVLRVYNEAQAHISHVVVVEAPTGPEEIEPGVLGADTRYLRATLAPARACRGGGARRVLVAACGRAGGAPGRATALGVWPLRALHVPPLCAAERGGLRVARRRRAPRVDDPEPPAPSEDEVRALCAPPAALCPLQARVLGLAPHPNGECVWAMEEGGRASCVSLPALQLLRVLEAHSPHSPQSHHLPHSPHSPFPHYVHAAVSRQFIASPVGSEEGRVAAWSARSGASAAPPPPARRPAPCVLLPPAPAAAPAQMLLLGGDVVFVYESRATPQV